MNHKPGVHRFKGNKRRYSRRAGGFTLPEMLLVVGIIITLLGIGTAVAVKMVAEARKEQVRTMMQGLLGANAEFKAKLQGGAVNHDGSFPINWATEPRGDQFSACERFVYGVRKSASAEQMLIDAISSSTKAELARTFVDKDGDGVEEIYDRWGSQIEYRSRNNQIGNGPVMRRTRDNPLTGATANSKLPLSKHPIFVSAGPDKEFGTDDDITSELK